MSNSVGTFLKQFVSEPMSVGSIIPSSRFLSRKMIRGIENPTTQCIVELGPGTGAITHHINQNRLHQSRYLGFEISYSFHQILSNRFPDLQFINEGAENMLEYLDKQEESVDIVISSIPFTTIPRDLSEQILDVSFKALKKGGVFRTFLYCHTYFLKKNQQFVLNCQQNFGQQHLNFIPINIPPRIRFDFLQIRKVPSSSSTLVNLQIGKTCL